MSEPKQQAPADNEAVDLLMLFSTQAKTQAQPHTETTAAAEPSPTPADDPTTTSTTSPPPPARSPPAELSNFSKQVNDFIKSPIATSNATNPPSKTNPPNTTTTTSSFQMQRRASSVNRDNSAATALRMDQVSRSPGPAAAALATGTSGNSSNKAIVAAAALAAAAATPLPIFRKSDHNEERSKSNEKLAEPIDLNKKQKENKEKPSRQEKKVAKTSAETKVKEETVPKTKKEKTTKSEDNELPPYAVGPDAGIISCVCGFDHDDGLTIQCDKCFRWQHLVCMGFDSINDTPDDFQCNLCNKNLHVDAAKARKLQENYLKEEKTKRKRSPYANDSVKATNMNVGAAQFKKRKVDENSAESVGIDKYNTLYFPINYFVYQSSAVKSLFIQLPDILKKNKHIMKLDKTGLNKLVAANSSSINIKSASENAKMKFTGISKLGLYTTKVIKENSFISLLSGEVDTKQNHISEKMNKYWLLGCPKPNVFFHPELPIVIDERGLGNHTRFIRKSCKPNCEIRTIIVNKHDIAFGLFSLREIKTDTELTLPWEWDAEHPILGIINNSETFENMDNEMKTVLINSIQSVLDLTDCGCTNSSSDCTINKVKKLSAYLQRNTRKNNITHSSPTPNQKYIPIDERYKERNEFILKNIRSTENLLDDETNGEDNIQQNGESESNGEGAGETIQDGVSTNTDGTINFNFKPKLKNTIYNLHILPKQFELIKKYYQNSEVIRKMNEEDRETKQQILLQLQEEENKEINDESEMPIPVEVNAKVLQKLNTASTDPASTSGTKEVSSAAGIESDEKPKVVKKFSLADYKKKKTG